MDDEHKKLRDFVFDYAVEMQRALKGPCCPDDAEWSAAFSLVMEAVFGPPREP